MFEANLKSRLGLLLCGAVLAFALSTAWSQAYKHFPGPPEDQRTFRTKERVDELYDAGDYRRALLIYEKELAPIGDKYAQYMVGYMYLAGQSVPPQKVTALAWYRLAAERGQPVIVQARDELMQSMSAAEVEESNRIYSDIWQKFGDNRILLDLIQEDMKTLNERTGSRLNGGDTSPLTVISVRSGNAGAEKFYEQIRERVELRLDYLETEVEITDMALESDLDDIRNLEEDIRRRYSALRSP